MAPHEEIARLLRDLEATPIRLEELFASQDEAALRARPAPDRWSPLDALVHLRASDEIISPRIVQILVRDDPPLPAFDERRWAEVSAYGDFPVALVLARFAARRDELLHLLRRCHDGDWQRPGQHETHGRRTLLDLTRHLTAHESEHLTQVADLLS